MVEVWGMDKLGEIMYPIQEVLAAIKRGYSVSNEIAEVTGIERNIVSSHLTSLYQLGLIEKTGIRKQENGRGPSQQVYMIGE